MPNPFTRKNFRHLTKRERAEVMQLQMSQGSGGRSPYLPDDCAECDGCGDPMLSGGFCDHCFKRFDTLMMKLTGETS